MTPLALPLAANDGFGIVVAILVMVASGVFKFLKEKSEEAAKRRQMEQISNSLDNPNRSEDINELLSEVTAASQAEARRRRQAPMELTEADLVDSRPARKQRRPEPITDSDDQPRRAVSQRHLKDSRVGQVANRHVANQIRDHHLQSQVESKHLKPELELGIGGVSTRSTVSSDEVHPIAAMLASGNGVQSAIIMNEILGSPVSRRK